MLLCLYGDNNRKTVRLNNEILNKVTTLTTIEKTTKSEIIKKAIIVLSRSIMPSYQAFF